MGAFCCCPCSDDFDEYAYPSYSVYRHCVSLRFFFHRLLTAYGAMFHRLDGRSTSPTQVGTSLVPAGVITGLSDDSVNDPHTSLARPVSFDNNQRYTWLQRDGLVSRKSITHFQEESHPLGRNASSSGLESLGFLKKQNANYSEEDSRLRCSEDEDVCPTCLDEYTPENPKITTRCSHHFHLGCIYEWLERSKSCPICGKEMEFCESP